ncbi:uncharacterized protein GLRG_05896 [Colletotrichum graminicola M1.001]|uniref:4'-phosphopantetheinyl transferase domain-containing protein n=1 Tax=Colletotrichum graminicola (strain M1.001 / M2 / FGSC 10212) TaxID=645133 RepID=E3QIR4_COLGM|nr:uncharacterized protein GLRG_05896 [Colletotrichum graminicola M1.001]EFQ30752.1 hypothetical protein GLRG_05896 [Colletotrichum graminicola M1.001]
MYIYTATTTIIISFATRRQYSITGPPTLTRTCNNETDKEARFAAKEATFKAHPFRRLSFHDITIVRRALVEGKANPNGSGPPVAIIRGEREGEPGQTAMVSISHDGDYATAVCLGFEPETRDGKRAPGDEDEGVD